MASSWLLLFFTHSPLPHGGEGSSKQPMKCESGSAALMRVTEALFSHRDDAGSDMSEIGLGDKKPGGCTHCRGCGQVKEKKRVERGENSRVC